MEFDLVMFTLSLTLEECDKCRKKDLISTAELFNVFCAQRSKEAGDKRRNKLYRKHGNIMEYLHVSPAFVSPCERLVQNQHMVTV